MTRSQTFLGIVMCGRVSLPITSSTSRVAILWPAFWFNAAVLQQAFHLICREPQQSRPNLWRILHSA